MEPKAYAWTLDAQMYIVEDDATGYGSDGWLRALPSWWRQSRHNHVLVTLTKRRSLMGHLHKMAVIRCWGHGSRLIHAQVRPGSEEAQGE